MGPVVWEEKVFKEIVDDARWTPGDPKSSHWALCAQVRIKILIFEKYFQVKYVPLVESVDPKSDCIFCGVWSDKIIIDLQCLWNALQCHLPA